MTRCVLGALVSALLLAAPSARAEDVKAGDLVITQAWTRATPGGAKTGGGFLTIENKGSAPDRLVGVSADAAGKVEVHEMAMDGGVMKMRPVEGGLTIDPGKTVKLAPGGLHLMMMDLKSPLKQGDKLPVTLQFEKAGKVASHARRAGRRRARTVRQCGRRNEEDGSRRDEDVTPEIFEPGGPRERAENCRRMRFPYVVHSKHLTRRNFSALRSRTLSRVELPALLGTVMRNLGPTSQRLPPLSGRLFGWPIGRACPRRRRVLISGSAQG